MPEPKLTVDLSGPFFRRDPGKTLRGNVRDMMDGLAEWMQREAIGAFTAAAGDMPGSRGRSRSTLRGYTTSVMTGRRWDTVAALNVVTTGMSKADAIGAMAAVYGRRQGRRGIARGIEQRFHPFRRVTSAIYRSRPLLTANLTKGIE